MPNPAYDLHELFQAWRQAQRRNNALVSPATARGWNEGEGDAAAQHREAMRLLDAVERAIDDLESLGRRVRVHRSNLVGWTKVILAYPHAWTGNVDSETVVPMVLLDHLETLGELIESNLMIANPAQIAQIQDVVNEARGLLHADESIDARLRQYLVELVREVQNALDDTAAGTFDFRRAAERLWVAMHAAGGSSEKKTSAWRTAADKLLIPVTVGVATHLSGIGIDAVAGALTPGSGS